MNLDELWRELAGEQIANARPDFRFNRDFYIANAPDLGEAGIDYDAHYAAHGFSDGRLGNNYQAMSLQLRNLDRRLDRIVVEPRLREAIKQGVPDAYQLLFELVMLGGPVDLNVSNFSAKFYLGANPDLREAGVQPFLHFIQHGINEKRRTLGDVRQNRHEGRRAFNPALPTVMICVHECSKTGAPIVGLDLVKSAAETQNVVVAALRGGQLLDRFMEHAVEVLISEAPDEDFDYFQSDVLKSVSMAVLNSVECYPFARPLLRFGVPWASYLHEYTDYSLPAYKCTFMALYSDLLVFSSEQVRKSWEPLFADVGFDVDRDSMILPQHEFRLGGVARKPHANAVKTLSDLIGVDCTNRRVVLGAGHVQWRKGTDLFVLTAQIARSRGDDTIFVWIGDGVNHEDVHFGVWLDKHMREAQANAPGGTLHFLPAGPYYLDLCRAADAFFLSSRLDPLPNVVFDAAEHGCHTVLFQNASGFDDPMYTQHPNIKAVEYGNIDAACHALLSVPKKIPAPKGHKPDDAPSAIFGAIIAALSDRLARHDHFVIGGGRYDVPALFPSEPEYADARKAERDKIWSYDRRFVWPSLQAAQNALAQSDNWVHKTCRIERYAPFTGSEVPDFNVHIHAHYTDGLGGDLLYYAALKQAARIVVTTDTVKKERQIAHIAADAGIDVEVIRMPNAGRDILPFMRLFSEGHADEDSIWCHMHQKKSLGTMRSGETWKSFLQTILLGADEERSNALRHIADPQVGLVAPFDPYQVNWNGSRRLLPRIKGRFDKPLPDDPIVFPVGNMFWTRGAVVAQMNRIFGPNYPWPNEPLPNDGTEFHLIERLWPTAVAMTGYRSVFLEKADQQRG